jgi:DNA end-binding protein Ku
VAESEVSEPAAPRPFWSGTITFGLVSVPVNLFPASRAGRASLRMLGPDGVPLARRYVSAETGRPLGPEDLVRGAEIDGGQYVPVTDDELERLAPEKSRDIDLRRFVDAAAVPPLAFERAYFLVPAGTSSRAYQLLAAVMERSRKAGIATFVMRGKEYLVAILAERGILRAETLRFADEIRSPADVGLPDPVKVPAAALRRFQKLIDEHAADALPREELRDQRTEALARLVERKRARNEDVIRTDASADTGRAEVIDIMSVLKRRLAATARDAGAGRRRQTGPERPGRAPRAAGDLERLSRAALYDRAKALGLPGRSAMTKTELIRAIREVA